MTRIEKQTLDLFGKGRNGKSDGTKEKTLQQASVIGRFMQSQGLRNIQDMKFKHCKNFMKELDSKGSSLSTKANYASVLRTVADKIGKGDMIPRTNQEAFGFTRDLGDRRQPVTADLAKAQSVNDRLAAQGKAWIVQGREMAEAFGLRRSEALRNFTTIEKDGKTYLVVDQGTKGGKERFVEVVTAHQRQVLDSAREMVASQGGKSLIPQNMKLHEGLRNYSNAVHRAGGTKEANAHTHALRHEYVQSRSAEGIPDKALAEEIGHGRTEVLNCYKP